MIPSPATPTHEALVSTLPKVRLLEYMVLQSVFETDERTYNPTVITDSLLIHPGDHAEWMNRMRTIWNVETDGYGSVDIRDRFWPIDDDVQTALTLFAKFTSLARAPMNRDQEGKWQRPDPKALWRPLSQYTRTAAARALIHERDEILMEDIELVARLVLSTVPAKCRPYVR